jgi:hypothetical protein
LFSTRIVRVFDELILNPIEDSEFLPSTIKKELKEMRREAKSQAWSDSVLEEPIANVPEIEQEDTAADLPDKDKDDRDLPGKGPKDSVDKTE